MNRNDATFQALGYAWGQEDATGQATHATAADPTGSMAFANAFADGWDEYNAGRRGMMTNLRDAYARWQETGPGNPVIWGEHEPSGQVRSRG